MSVQCVVVNNKISIDRTYSFSTYCCTGIYFKLHHFSHLRNYVLVFSCRATIIYVANKHYTAAEHILGRWAEQHHKLYYYSVDSSVKTQFAHVLIIYHPAVSSRGVLCV